MKKLLIIFFIVNAPFTIAMNKSTKEQEAWVILKKQSKKLLELCNDRLYSNLLSSADQESLNKDITRCQNCIDALSRYLMSLHTPEKHLKYLIKKRDLFKDWTKNLIGNTYYFSNIEQPVVDDCLAFFKQSDYVKAFCATTRNYIFFNISYEQRKKNAQKALQVTELDIKLFEMSVTPKICNNNADEIMRD